MPDPSQIIAPESQQWEATLEMARKSICSIRYCRTHHFDGTERGAFSATGFLVDEGFVLTNKHVVGPSPWWGHCVFEQKQEVCILQTRNSDTNA